jgi:hypothetical protein
LGRSPVGASEAKGRMLWISESSRNSNGDDQERLFLAVAVAARKYIAGR